ncbi:MAG TPA: 3-deoxy-manno-octulosonate cytidylyltransferase [Steroidobacteraceae bacterium]
MFRIVIPARYGSLRLPGKVLLSICGKPMLQWVYERARASRAQEVLIATDDARIMNAAQSFGAQAIMTAAAHPSGTDRIAEVARCRSWAAADIIVNVQADEPLIPPALIDQVGALLESDAQADMATLATPVGSLEEFLDPNVVKVVADERGRALYFSRAPIPFERDNAAQRAVPAAFAGARRHVGIYGYRVGPLLRLAALPPGRLERCEQLEQLRALANGYGIQLADAAQRPGPDVNTVADLERVSELLRS